MTMLVGSAKSHGPLPSNGAARCGSHAPFPQLHDTGIRKSLEAMVTIETCIIHRILACQEVPWPRSVNLWLSNMAILLEIASDTRIDTPCRAFRATMAICIALRPLLTPESSHSSPIGMKLRQIARCADSSP